MERNAHRKGFGSYNERKNIHANQKLTNNKESYDAKKNRT